MRLSRVNKSTQRSFWISALFNRSLVAAMQTAKSRQSMHVLCDRLGAYLGLKVEATSFLPIYNPQDQSRWPELLGWLVTIAEMEVVEELRAEEILRQACEDAYQAQALGDDTDAQVNIATGCLWDARKYLKGQFTVPRTHELMGLYTRQHFEIGGCQ